MKCAPCHPERRDNEQHISELCSDEPSLCQACTVWAATCFSKLWKSSYRAVLIRAHQSFCRATESAAVGLFAQGKSQRCLAVTAPLISSAWSRARLLPPTRLRPLSAQQRKWAGTLQPVQAGSLPMAGTGVVHGGVLCLQALASACAPAELCWEKAVTVSVLRHQTAKLQDSNHHKGRSISPVLMGTCKKMNVGCIFRAREQENVENIGEFVVWTNSKEQILHPWRWRDWGGRCMSQRDY